MSIPTTNELALLRSQPHRTKLHMSIYQPSTVWAAQVDDADAAKGDRVIPYDNKSGSRADVERGMTMYVGTSAGAKDKGSVYVKRVTADNVIVGENSHIDWADDDHLTIINFFQIWPLYPRYTQDEENITVYKDYNVIYTNQNEILGSFICMGPHHAGFLDDGDHNVYFTASGTTHVGGDSLSYHWLFPGGTPTGSSVHTPGNVLYSNTGHYTASLTVSGTSTGAVDVSHRHISIYDRPEEGTNVPTLSWGMNLFAGDRGAGGYTVRMWVREDIASIDNGALVVLFADDWYDETKQSIGGNALNRSSIKFVGYILDGTIDYNYQTSTVTFDVGSPTEVMKLVEAFSVSVQDSTSPSDDANNKGGDPWFYLVGLSMQTALYHYTRWHSTINLCGDIEYTAIDQLIQFFDADRSSLYDAVDSLMTSTVLGKSVCDKQGKLFFDNEAEAVPDALTDIPASMSVEKRDWINVPSIIERTSRDLSYLEVGGVQWDGADVDTFTPYLLAAPGEVPAYRGRNQRISGLAFSSLAQAKTLSGDLYANRNSQFPTVSLNIGGNYGNFDIAPLEAVNLSLEAADTFRGLAWTDKPFSINRIEWLYDSAQQFLRPNIAVAEITEGFDADDLEIPEIPPSEGYDQPPVVVPPLPIWPSPSLPSVPSEGTIWVPALGGNYNNAVQLVYGGDGNSNEESSGVSFDESIANRVDTVAHGAFLVPNGFSNMTIYAWWRSSATLLGYESGIYAYKSSDGDDIPGVFAYISETLAPVVSKLEVGTGFTTDEWSSTFPAEDMVVLIYARGTSSDSDDGNERMLGWYVVFD